MNSEVGTLCGEVKEMQFHAHLDYHLNSLHFPVCHDLMKRKTSI